MKKILVIQQKMIGDVLVSSIICNNLKKAYPNSEVHYMVYESTTPVLEGNTSIDKLILFKEEYRKSKWAFFKFLLSIRKEKYDIVIDAYSKLESWLTVFFSGSTQKISYLKKGRSFLYTDNIKMLEKPKTNLGLTIERRLSLLDPLNLKVELDPIPKLYVTEKENEFIKKYLNDKKLDTNKKTVMVSINGSSAIKTYPLIYMSNIVDFIADNTNVNILFNYMPDQIEDARKIYDGCKDSTKKHIQFDIIAGKLREYIALMNNCDVIIGNDGGAINIAKSLKKPSFIIFSPWIEKRMWATFEDGKFHRSVHLQDFIPKLFIAKSEKELKRDSLKLYEEFKPEFIYESLKPFLDFNLSSKSKKLAIRDLIKQNKVVDNNNLSAAIITLNEEKNLKKLLPTLAFADEIVIVDSYSTDDTETLVKEFPKVKFIQRKFMNYSDQRNFTIEQTKNDWVLFVDADERVGTLLKDEINSVLENSEDIVAYGIRRQFYFKNEILKFSGFQTDRPFRLFNKNFAKYDEQKLVHETVVFNGKMRVLKNKLDHFSFKNYNDYKEKMSSYARLRAEELYLKKMKPNFYHFNIKHLYRFFYHYVIRLGFLDGKKGYIISTLNAYGVKQRYVNLKRKYNSAK